MKTPRIVRSATLRGRRGIVLFVSGALAMGIGVAGVRALAERLAGAAEAHREPKARRPRRRSFPRPSRTRARRWLRPSRHHRLSRRRIRTRWQTASTRRSSAPSTSRAATVTIDVLQSFVGGAGAPGGDRGRRSLAGREYDPVYLRNENPLLRTLPVADGPHRVPRCSADAPNRGPASRGCAGRRRRSPRPSTTRSRSMDSSVVGIQQKIAVSAC